jgi:hypothetical protein
MHQALDATVPKKLGKSTDSVIIHATNITRDSDKGSRRIEPTNKDSKHIFIAGVSDKTVVSNK